MAHLSRLSTSRLSTSRVLLPALVFALACGGSQTGSEDAAPRVEADAPEGVFSRDLAWEELERLASLGPRPVGSEAVAEARRQIRDRIAGWQIDVREVTTTAQSEGYGPIVLTHLVATLPGRSSDRFVLIAPYDSGTYDFAFQGVNDGASGAALLVELARVLSDRERPYTIELVWLEGEGRLGRGGAADRDLRWLGSAGLAEQWRQEGRLEGIRLLVEFNRVCDADLRLARDLHSHRTHREDFWQAARVLGRGEAFSETARYESLTSSHMAFRERGLTRVVAIEDSVFGGDEAPGLFAGEDDALAHCAPESLETVGKVALDALDTIGTRLAKIDRFARTPSVEPDVASEPVAGTPDDPAAEAATASEADSAETPEPTETPDAPEAL